LLGNRFEEEMLFSSKLVRSSLVDGKSIYVWLRQVLKVKSALQSVHCQPELPSNYGYASIWVCFLTQSRFYSVRGNEYLTYPAYSVSVPCIWCASAVLGKATERAIVFICLLISKAVDTHI
jgi:hypothetical protein